jgi:hypothetical protein
MHVKTPLFITNSLFDIYQHYRFMELQCDPTPEAEHGKCNEHKIEYMNNYRQSMVDVLNAYLDAHPTSGAWTVSCWSHPIKNHDFYWNHATIGIAGKKNKKQATLQTIFTTWYEDLGRNRIGDRSKYIRIDGPWGANVCI